MKSDKKQEEQLPTKETEIVEEKPKEEEKKAIDDNPLISVPPIEDPTEEKPKEESKEEKPKEVSTEEKEVPKEPEKVKPISEFELINQDPSLKNYEWNIKHRVEHFKRQLETIEKNEKSLIDFANSYKHMGLILQENNDYIKFSHTTDNEYSPTQDPLRRYVYNSDTDYITVLIFQLLVLEIILTDHLNGISCCVLLSP